MCGCFNGALWVGGGGLLGFHRRESTMQVFKEETEGERMEGKETEVGLIIHHPPGLWYQQLEIRQIAIPVALNI